MHYRILSGLIVFCLALAAGMGCGGGNGSQDIRDITVAEADSIIAANRENPDFVLLDLRTPGEFDRARIAGSINIDQTDEAFPDNLDTLEKSRTYLFFCSDDKRSLPASELMKEQGFARAYRMAGGIVAWALAGNPVERPAPAAPAEAPAAEIQN